MRVFNYASQPSWMGLLAAALLGTSTVQAVELDVEDRGKFDTLLPVHAQQLIQNQRFYQEGSQKCRHQHDELLHWYESW
jgi:hypothetical protein